MNYMELKSLVTVYLKRSDLEDLYNTFRDLAEQLIAKRAQITAMEVEATIAAGTALDGVALPVGWGSYKSVRAGGEGFRVSLNPFTRQQFANSQNRSGYCIDGGKIFIGSNNTSDIQTTYYQRPQGLVENMDTNKVLTDASTLYLFGMLIYAADSMQDDDLLTTWSTRFQVEIDLANDNAKNARLSGGAPQIQGG